MALPPLTITSLPSKDAKKNEELLNLRERKWRDEALYWRTRAEAREIVAAVIDLDSLRLALDFYADPLNYCAGNENKILLDKGDRAKMAIEATLHTLEMAKRAAHS